MFSQPAFDPDHVVAQLRGPLLRQPSRALVYALGAPQERPVFDVHPLGGEWQPYSAPQVLLALSYQFHPYGPGLQGLGVWLPEYGTLQLADTGMRTQTIALGHPSTPHLPEAERAAVSRELRGVVGTLAGRPGRHAGPPLLLCDSPADVQPLIGEIGEAGLAIDVARPAQAAQYWPAASFVFVHHQVADRIADLALPPRADVAILTARRTARISAAADRLHTDEVLEYPGCIEYLVLLLGRHHQMVALGRTRPRF